MSIYFTQVVTALLGFVIFAALNNKTKSFTQIFLPSILGIVVGICMFKFTHHLLLDAAAKLIFDSLSLAFLLISILWIFFEFKLAKTITFFVLAACYGFTYASISALFPLFGGELLDTTSVISLFLLCFAVILSVLIFFLVSGLKESFSPAVLKIFTLVLLFALIFERVPITALEFMRAGHIPTYPWALSIVAKGVYIGSFMPYFYAFLGIVLDFYAFVLKPKRVKKDEVGSISYRFNLAKINRVNFLFRYSFVSLVIMVCFSLYYDLYASRPPSISTPIIIEPENGKFIFDAEKLRDNKLHRYAYITDEGKEVRFFLLNRFKDRLSPTIVFDACMICGDMGYAKNGDELICIACNVRIFLPSVGKEGGCNPIPMEHKFDGRYITVEYDTIVFGANFFSKTVEKMVTDPVSRKKVSNLESKSYLYYGRRYFFENNETQAKFEAEPEKYVDINGSLK